ncbi:MAG: VOC family protein [Dehalococcoidia bacterium]
MQPRFTELVFRVADIEAEAAFYEEAVGLTRLRPKPGEPIDRVVVFDMGGPRLELHHGGRTLERPTARDQVSCGPVLLVDDCEAALERAVGWGATQVGPISAPVPGSAFVYVLSPGGQAVGFVQGDERQYRARLGMPPQASYWPAE